MLDRTVEFFDKFADMLFKSKKSVQLHYKPSNKTFSEMSLLLPAAHSIYVAELTSLINNKYYLRLPAAGYIVFQGPISCKGKSLSEDHIVLTINDRVYDFYNGCNTKSLKSYLSLLNKANSDLTVTEYCVPGYSDEVKKYFKR